MMCSREGRERVRLRLCRRESRDIVVLVETDDRGDGVALVHLVDRRRGDVAGGVLLARVSPPAVDGLGGQYRGDRAKHVWRRRRTRCRERTPLAGAASATESGGSRWDVAEVAQLRPHCLWPLRLGAIWATHPPNTHSRGEVAWLRSAGTSTDHLCWIT